MDIVMKDWLKCHHCHQVNTSICEILLNLSKYFRLGIQVWKT